MDNKIIEIHAGFPYGLNSREGLLRVLKSCRASTFLWDLKKDSAIFDDNAQEVYGLVPDSFDYYLNNIVHPDDREKLSKSLHQIISSKKFGITSYRIIRPDNNQTVVLCVIGYPSYDEDEIPLYMEGISIVTEKLFSVEEEKTGY